MALFLFCHKPNAKVIELADRLGSAVILKKFDGLDFWRGKRRADFEGNDTLICWGMQLPELDGIRVINGGGTGRKNLDLLYQVRLIGYNTPAVTKTVEGYDYSKPDYAKYLHRTYRSYAGLDLLSGEKNGDYIVRKMVLRDEYKIHVIGNRIIKAGMRVPDPLTKEVSEGEWVPNKGLRHPWVRSVIGGWTVDYTCETISSALRQSATATVKALGLSFACIDIATDVTGTYYITGVSISPDLEDPSIMEAYVTRLTKLINAESKPEKVVK